MNRNTGGSGTGLVGHEMVHTPLAQQTIHSLKGVEDSTQAGITGHFEVVGQVILCDITILVSVNDCKSPQLLLYFSKIHPECFLSCVKNKKASRGREAKFLCFCHQDEVLHGVTRGVDTNSPEGGGQGLWLDVQTSSNSYLGTKHLDEKN